MLPLENKLVLNGKYTNGIIWLVAKPDGNHIEETEMKFANSILAQIPDIEANIDNIGWVNLAEKSVGFIEIVRLFKPKYVFAWGVKNQLTGLSKGALVPEFMGKCGLIQCPSIAGVKEDINAKGQLWQSMKVLFNIT